MPPIVIAFLAAVAGGGFYLWNKNKTQATANAKASIPPIPPPGLTFDPGMTQDTQNTVNAALLNENDPAKLISLATILSAKGYRNSALALQSKANAVSITGTPVIPPALPQNVLVQPPGGTAPPVVATVDSGLTDAQQALVSNPSVASLDPGMDAITAGYVAQALATQTDIPSLIAMADTLNTQGYHNSAMLIKAKVISLQAAPIDSSASDSMSVTQLQKALNIIGVSGTPIVEDGIPSQNLVAIIATFQNQGGLTPTGIPDSQTISVMRTALNAMGKTV